MTANEAKIIEFMSSTGPLTHGESAALIELFRDKAHRLDQHTKVEIGQAMRQPYQERVASLRDLSQALENELDEFNDVLPSMTNTQKAKHASLVATIHRITNYIDERM